MNQKVTLDNLYEVLSKLTAENYLKVVAEVVGIDAIDELIDDSLSNAEEDTLEDTLAYIENLINNQKETDL